MGADVTNDVVGYVEALSFYRPPGPAEYRPVRSASVAAEPPLRSAVDVGAVVAFADTVPEPQRQDILDTVQLAQRAASGLFDRHTQMERWYGKFREVMERVGWTTSQFAFVEHKQEQGDLKVDARALKILVAVATQNALGVLTESLSMLQGMADGEHAISVFSRFASKDLSGNYQLGAADLSKEGALSMGLGAFYFHAKDQRTKTLLGSWGENEIIFWSAAQRMTLNQKTYDLARAAVQKQLGDPSGYIAELTLG